MRRPSEVTPQVWYGGGLTAVACLLAGLAIVLEAEQLMPGMNFGQLFSYQLATYGNTLLAVATAIYLANLWFRAEAVGRWGSRLAAAGAAVVLAGSFTHWYEMERVLPRELAGAANLYGALLVVSAITVLAYLGVEHAYRNRSAGAVFMPIIMSAVATEIWLLSHGQGLPSADTLSLIGYWMDARTLAAVIGFAAFAVTAAAGVGYLLRYRAEEHGESGGLALRVLPNLWHMYGLMFSGLAVGLPVFAVATALGAASAHHALGSVWAGGPAQAWVAAVFVVYGALTFGQRYLSGPRLAWWSVVGFGAASCLMLGLGVASIGSLASAA